MLPKMTTENKEENYNIKSNTKTQTVRLKYRKLLSQL